MADESKKLGPSAGEIFESETYRQWEEEHLPLFDGLIEAFKEEPAKKRFYEWFSTSELTLSETGAHTNKKLGELLGVSGMQAGKYVKGEIPLSEKAIYRLMFLIGLEGVYNIAYGEESYISTLHHARQQKRLEELREALKASINEMNIEELERLSGYARALQDMRS